MSTVKKVVKRKRAKRTVDNMAFDAFARRILKAYARRVATGDVDALRSLSMLSGEVDAVIRQAVTGLRKVPYSWSEIGWQLGVSRQAAQMRFGDKAERGALDRRLTQAGMNVTVSALVAVFIEHDPGIPAEVLCPGCGFTYPDDVSECPSRATARPLLYRRRNQDPQAMARLSAIQSADLHLKATRKNRAAVQSARPTAPDRAASDLFSLNGKDAAS